MIEATYILPIKAQTSGGLGELTEYLRRLPVAQIVIADGSPGPVFDIHAQAWRGFAAHVKPKASGRDAADNGKVLGVLAALRVADCERIVVADDDVRYDAAGLERIVALLDRYDVVRPQNYFDPMPWHAVLDTSRILLNRVTGGDWPGTLAFRRSALARGYRADVLFENLELVRTVVASGGRERVADGVFVRRQPPTVQHYLSQRVRQAYDEFARPARLAGFLAIVPVVTACIAFKRWDALMALSLTAVFAAEIGRRRRGGALVFPAIAALLAPLWLMERGCCSWVAVMRRACGGVRYGSSILRDAATPLARLKAGS